MMDDYVIVTVDGTDYYCPSNLVQYLSSDLINTGSTTITLYKNINHSNVNNYPYIQCRSLSYPVLFEGYNDTTELSNVSVLFNSRASFLREFDIVSLVLQIIIALLLLMNFFLRRSR